MHTSGTQDGQDLKVFLPDLAARDVAQIIWTGEHTTSSWMPIIHALYTKKRAAWLSIMYALCLYIELDIMIVIPVRSNNTHNECCLAGFV